MKIGAEFSLALQQILSTNNAALWQGNFIGI